MGAPLRSPEEITAIINNGQHAIGDLGLELVRLEKNGVDNTDPDYRQKQIRLILLRIYFQNILDEDGEIIAFYQDSDNEKAQDNILTGIYKLSGLFGGPAIPKITGDNIPVVFFPSTRGSTPGGNTGGAATPGGVVFENLDVDSLDLLIIGMYLCDAFSVPEAVGKEMKPETVREMKDFLVNNTPMTSFDVEAALMVVV